MQLFTERVPVLPESVRFRNLSRLRGNATSQLAPRRLRPRRRCRSRQVAAAQAIQGTRFVTRAPLATPTRRRYPTRARPVQITIRHLSHCDAGRPRPPSRPPAPAPRVPTPSSLASIPSATTAAATMLTAATAPAPCGRRLQAAAPRQQPQQRPLALWATRSSSQSRLQGERVPSSDGRRATQLAAPCR